MATNLQVNASTSQAASAFDRLADAISRSRGQFDQLTSVVSKGIPVFSTYGERLTNNIGGAFQKLTSLSHALFGALTLVGSGIQLVFNSLLHELDKLQGFNAIMMVSTKSSGEASNAYNFLRKTADLLGVQFDALSNNYAKLTAAIPEGVDRMRVAEKAFLGVAMASRTLHASNQDTQLMFYAITQMASKGVLSMEELRRQLGEKLPGSITIAAKSVNATVSDFLKAVSLGLVDSAKFLPIFGDALIRTFNDSSQKASTSVSAAINRLTNVWVDFVKTILDSGASSSIIGVFDQLREKLGDPYIIKRFADLVKYLADKFTEFIASVSKDDIRNGFDTFTRGMEMAIALMGKLISMFTWIINNAGKAGAIIGGIGGGIIGLSVGILGGPVAAAVAAAGGAATGAAVGAYAGNSLKSTPEQIARRKNADIEGNAAVEKSITDKNNLLYTEMIPLLQQFKGLNTFNGLENLMKAENLNSETLTTITRILKDPTLKNDQQRVNSLKDFSKYGIQMGSTDHTLKDVLKDGAKVKKDPELAKLDATEARAFGLDPSFVKEWGRLTTLFKAGRIDLDMLTDAQAKLLSKQPVIAEYNNLNQKAQDEFSKSTTEQISQAIKLVEYKEKMSAQLDAEVKNAGTHAEDLRAETEFNKRINQYAEHRIELGNSEKQVLREKLDLIQRMNEISAAEDRIIAGTLDKYRGQVLQVQALVNLQKPEAGINQITNSQARNVIQDANPELFANENDALDRQKAANDDFYAYLDVLRINSLVSEENYQAAKARIEINYSEQRLAGTKDFFGNLASLSSSGNSKIAAIGRAAAMTSATIDGVLAVQKALAAPPGWPYNAPNVIAVGISAAANVAKIAGFESGGYTGDGGVKDIAGYVHGKEFVVHADATAKNRAALEAMNRGSTVGDAPKVLVLVTNNSSGTKTSQTERDTPDGKQIEVIIEDVVTKSVRRGGRIADAMEGQYNLNRSAGAAR